MSRVRVPTRFVAALILSAGLAVIASTPVRGAAGVRIIKIMDQCDPASFNAAGIPCVGKGGVTLDTLLNQLSGNPVPAPECTTEFNPEDFVAPGAATEAEDEEPGVHHYQCCIHPWMRVDVIVR